MNFKVIFTLDSTGLMYDPNEPLHLDALLAWELAPRQGIHQHLMRDDKPIEIPLPLQKYGSGDQWVWRASALLPEGAQTESLMFWRRRFRQNRADLTIGSPNLTNGPYCERNMPMPMMLVDKLVGYASGDRSQCKKLLKDVIYLGKKRREGRGKIISIELIECEQDRSIEKDGRAMRWLPDEHGTRFVRLRPPYWNSIDRVQCCEVGTKRK